VLVAGGLDFCSGNCLPTPGAELYDPTTGTWSYTGQMIVARAGHSATLLPNGQVLVAGGAPIDEHPGYLALAGRSTAELYDPSTGVWSATRSMADGRACHTAALLSNGDVLVAGGVDGTTTGKPATTADIFSMTSLPPPALLFLKLRLAHSTVKAGQRQTVKVSTVPLHAAVEADVRFPRGKQLTITGASDSSGAFTWSFRQPANAATPKSCIVTVSVAVKSGAQIPVTKVKKYAIG
jgi:hypothetical protein